MDIISYKRVLETWGYSESIFNDAHYLDGYIWTWLVSYRVFQNKKIFCSSSENCLKTSIIKTGFHFTDKSKFNYRFLTNN